MSGRAKIGASASPPLDPVSVLAATKALPDLLQPDFRKVVELLPAAVYVTDAEGRITYYNEAAAALWGYRPPLGDSHWCGSWRLYWSDGTPMAHDECPMARTIKEGRAIRGADAIAERPDGSRVRFMPFPTPLHDETGKLIGALNMLIDLTELKAAESALREQKRRLKFLNRVARSVSNDLDLERIVQTATDVATEITGAKFGAFFYRTPDDGGDSYLLYALSGAPREAFAGVGIARNTALVDPSFKAHRAVRSDDIRQDPRYTNGGPLFGVSKDHVPVVSYLAVPVVSKSGDVLGGLFFGHDQPGIFTQEAEEIVSGIAAHTALAVDNANLLCSAHLENVQRGRAEDDVRRLAAIIENSDDAIISKDLDGIITSWNRGAERLFGYTAKEAIGRPVTMLIPPERIDEEPGILARIRRGERIDHYDTIRRRKDGTPIDISLTVSPIKDASGKIIGASKIARDVTDRKRAELQQQLLVGEIKHRIKNTLATVQAIARQTLQQAPAAEREAFVGRLMALADAHDLLTLERWNRAALHDVVERALKPFQERHSARILVQGADNVWLDAQKASLLTMALHELATNAVKYGSLSNTYGIVRLQWDAPLEEEAQRVKISWREIGGPLVMPPERKGFGSFLIERAIQGGGGRARLDFNPNGLSCVLEVVV